MKDHAPADAPEGAAALHVDPETGEVLAEAPEDADDPVFIQRAVDEIAPGTMAGDIRDSMLNWIKSLRKPWHMLTEAQQREVISSTQLEARRLVRGALRTVAAMDARFVEIALAEANVKSTKDGRVIAGKFACIFSDQSHAFFGRHVGDRVLLVGMAADDYMGERDAARPDPDQPALPMGEEVAQDRPTAREIADEDAAAKAEADAAPEEPGEKPYWHPLREGEEPRPRPGMPFEEAAFTPSPGWENGDELDPDFADLEDEIAVPNPAPDRRRAKRGA